MVFDDKNAAVYSPAYPPEDLVGQEIVDAGVLPPNLNEIMSGGQRKTIPPKPLPVEMPSDFAIKQVAGRRMTFGKIPSEIDTAHLQIVRPEPKAKKKPIRSRSQKKFNRAFKKDLVAFQAENIGSRLTQLNPDDLIEDDLVPVEGGVVEQPDCCEADNYIDEEFENPGVQAVFMSKTYLLMSVYLLPAIIWTTAVLLNRKLHLYLSKGWGLYLTLSSGLWIGITLVGFKVRNFRICLALLVFRCLVFGHAIAALTLATERLVIVTAFDVEYKRRRNTTRRTTTTTTKRPLGVTTTTETPDYLDGFMYTEPYVWVIVLVLLFLIWVTTAFVLLCKKANPHGAWLYGIGGFYTVPGFLASVALTGVIGIGSGPELWDVTQIFVTNILAQIISMLVVVRWNQIFEGKLFFLTPDDYIYAALRLGF